MFNKILFKSLQYMPKEAAYMQVEEAMDRFSRDRTEANLDNVGLTMCIFLLKWGHDKPEFRDKVNKIFNEE